MFNKMAPTSRITNPKTIVNGITSNAHHPKLDAVSSTGTAAYLDLAMART